MSSSNNIYATVYLQKDNDDGWFNDPIFLGELQGSAGKNYITNGKLLIPERLAAGVSYSLMVSVYSSNSAYPCEDIRIDYAITPLEYSYPAISTWAGYRCNSSGVEGHSALFQYAKATAAWQSMFPSTGKAKWKQKGGANWSPEITITNNTATIIGGSLSNDSAYIMSLTVSDGYYSDTAEFEIPSQPVTVDFKSGGKGVAFGKVAESDNLLDSAWPVKAERLSLNNPLLVSNGGSGRSTLTSGYFLRGNGTGAVTLSSPSAVLSAIGAAPNVSSFKNLGNMGRFTSQTSLNNLLDNLTGDKYGNVENMICYLGVDFQSSQPYGWAAGCTVIATGGGTYSSQVLTGATGVFHRVLYPNGWLPWKSLTGNQVLYDNTSGTTGTITLSQSAANFSYMRVYYRDSDALYGSVDVYSPNGKSLWLSSAAIESHGTYFKRANIKISGNSITFTKNTEATIKGSTYNFYTGNYIYITRVEAWN